jgi:hypothetical protein
MACLLPHGLFAHSFEGLWGALGIILLVLCGIPLIMLPFSIAFRIVRKAKNQQNQDERDS